MEGILVVDKPLGPTSHDVVAKVRRALSVKKVGHTGTLDPMATGVLPLVLGRGTKLARYLTGGDKAYRAVVRLGTTTTTLDAEGDVVQTREVPQIGPEALEAALRPLRGKIKQIPPMFSAKKVEGKKLYELARSGVHIEREAKDVSVHQLELENFDGLEMTVVVTCSAGTYVRVLAQDIGEALGCGAHLKALRRISAGPFSLSDAVSLEDVLTLGQKIAERVKPLGAALSGLPRIEVPSELALRVANGHQLCVGDIRTLDVPAFAADEALTLSRHSGELVAIVRAALAKDDLPLSRRDTLAFKTERVL